MREFGQPVASAGFGTAQRNRAAACHWGGAWAANPPAAARDLDVVADWGIAWTDRIGLDRRFDFGAETTDRFRAGNGDCDRLARPSVLCRGVRVFGRSLWLDAGMAGHADRSCCRAEKRPFRRASPPLALARRDGGRADRVIGGAVGGVRPDAAEFATRAHGGYRLQPAPCRDRRLRPGDSGVFRGKRSAIPPRSEPVGERIARREVDGREFEAGLSGGATLDTNQSLRRDLD